MNRVIRFLISANFFLNSAWGFLAPIFALFILENITLADPLEAAKVAGFASLTYWVTKSFVQIPTSRYNDRQHGEKDDFWFMTGGMVLTAFAPLGFLIASEPWHIYALQVIHAVGMAFYVPSWNAIFTRHIDKGREAFEWAMDSTWLGFGFGITGGVGGIVVGFFGFNVLFILASALTFVAVIMLLLIHHQVLPKDHLFTRSQFHKKLW